jgi:hypothetical protein
MRVHGHTWDIGVIIGTSPGRLTWLQRLRQRIAAYRLQRKDTLLSRQYSCWDVRREQMRTPAAGSALECAAAQGGPAMAMTLYNANTDMASSS